jgi:plasmid maintenance system antidote protein VapI
MSELPFAPDWVSAPGETIADLLQERNLSPAEFASVVGLDVGHVNDLLRGRAPIAIDTANALQALFGTSVEFWLERESVYRVDLTRLCLPSALVGADWLKTLPIHDMVRFGWISRKTTMAAQISECLRFFGVPNEAAWQAQFGTPAELAAFRTSMTSESSPGAVAAWLRQGALEGRSINCQPWDKRLFHALLPSLRKLTRSKDPQRFLPKLVSECATCGVAVVVVRAPKGCRASGATMFIDQEKALLLLSFRDQFWFSFFHEAGHLVLHDKSRVFVETADMLCDDDEAEANRFSADMLIPARFKEGLMAVRPQYEDVIRFAQRIGVSAGVVVGQLQHLGIVRPSQLNQAKRRFKWS